MVDQHGTERVPDAVETELRQLLAYRAELTRKAADLSNANLARQYGVTPQYLRRLSRRIVVSADPENLYDELQEALHQRRQDYVLFQGQDGIVRVRPMDTALIRQDGFLGVVNSETTIADIQAMVEA